MSVPEGTPSREPTYMVAGLSSIWTRTMVDYPPPEWELSYAIRPPTGTVLPVEWGMEVTANGDTFEIIVPPSLTATITAAGRGRLTGVVTNGPHSLAIYDAPLDLRIVAGLSTAQTMLAAIDAMLLGNASREEEEIETNYGGVAKRLQLCSRDELYKMREYWLKKLEAEVAQSAVDSGMSPGNKILRQYRRPT